MEAGEEKRAWSGYSLPRLPSCGARDLSLLLFRAHGEVDNEVDNSYLSRRRGM